MTMPRCAACADRPVQHDQDTVCVPCLRLTRSRLRSIPELVEQLEVSLARQAVLADRNDGGKSAETALAYNEPAGDALRHIRVVLTGWVRLLHEERQVPLPRDEHASLAAHVSVHLGKLRAHPAAAELVAEVRDITDEAHRVVDLPVDRLRVVVGPCPLDYTDEHGTKAPCPGQVVATVPVDQHLPGRMECRACGATWRSDQWGFVGRLINERKAAA